jgi:cytosine/adenosine deaminase-related metal-dependent hydrolase
MPEYPEAAVQAAAEVALRQYDSQYSAGHLTWRDFADEVREILDAAAPVLAEAIAAKIAAHMEGFGPRAPVGALEPVSDQGRRYRTWRRYFGIAARIAAGAFNTEDEMKQMAAEAFNRGDFIACRLPEEDTDG